MRTVTLLLLVLFILGSSVGAASQVYPTLTAEEQAALWRDLIDAKNDPHTGKIGFWHVLEGISLIKRTDDVSSGAAALATIIQCGGVDKFIVGDDEVAAALTKMEEEKKLKDREIKKLRERFSKHCKMLSEEYEKAKKKRQKFMTRGVDFSLLIETYIGHRTLDIRKAIEGFASRRAYSAAITSKENPSLGYITNTLKENNPLILQRKGTDTFLICFGVFDQGGVSYVLTADPDKIDFVEISNADLIRGKSQFAEKLREAGRGFDKKFGLAKQDLKIQLAGEVPSGVEIIRWSPHGYTSLSVKFNVTEQSVERAFFRPKLYFPWL